MLNLIPDDQKMDFRRKVSAIALFIILLSFIILFTYVWKIFSIKSNNLSPSVKRKIWLAYLRLPIFIIHLIFNYYPLIAGAVMAFQNYNIMGNSTFIGLDNFAMVLFDKTFWLSMDWYN